MKIELCSADKSPTEEDDATGLGFLPSWATTNAQSLANAKVEKKLGQWIDRYPCADGCEKISSTRIFERSSSPTKPKRAWRFFFLFLFGIIPVPIFALVWEVKATFHGVAFVACVCK